MDTDTMIATALTVDGASIRLVIVTARAATEVRRLDATLFPQFYGFAVDADTMVWTESTASGKRGVHTQLWLADWRTTAVAGLKSMSRSLRMASLRPYAGWPGAVACSPGRRTAGRSPKPAWRGRGGCGPRRGRRCGRPGPHDEPDAAGQ
jgi:hypothetical protein